MPARTSTEFWETFKAKLRAMGLDTSNITEEEPAAATGSSGTRTYSVMFGPRRPIKPVNPQGGTDE